LKKLKKNTSNSHVKHWKSINEMPLQNWIECSSGSIQYARIHVNEEDKPNEKDVKSWEKLHDEYIEKYGLSDIYLRLLKVMQKKALLELNYVTTKERFKLTEIEIEEAKLNGMLKNNGSGLTIDESLIHLSKWIGYHLNPKVLTVIEYFNILKQYGKENKQK